MQLQELWLQTGMVFFLAAASAVALYVARRRVSPKVARVFVRPFVHQ